MNPPPLIPVIWRWKLIYYIRYLRFIFESEESERKGSEVRVSCWRRKARALNVKLFAAEIILEPLTDSSRIETVISTKNMNRVFILITSSFLWRRRLSSSCGEILRLPSAASTVLYTCLRCCIIVNELGV